MRRFRWGSTLAAIIAVAGFVAGIASALPDDPYMRFATLDHTIQNRVRWIYERIWFDPAPIDVAIIGPSRSGAGVSSPRLEADLAATGHPLRTVNFSLPENGRDLNWVILEQLLSTKHPRLIVIGVLEKPSRFGHPAYKYVAPAIDVIDPAYFGNLNYLSNLIYLPYRQLRLTAARLLPGAFDLPTRFDPGHYRGSNDDTTRSFQAADGHVVDRDHRVNKTSLEAQVADFERGIRPPLLGTAGRDVEFGDDRVYVARMARLATAHGARVAFLFLPYYTGPAAVQEMAHYARFGPLLDGSFVANHDEWYSDVAHLNHEGAIVLTDWLAPQVARLTEDAR
jgi:hypothetical protein